MRPIEKTLYELNAQNMEQSLEAIQKQIEYYYLNNLQTEGISLITIRDLLNEQYSDEKLRAMGFILNFTQFKEDAVKFLELVQKDSVLYNSRLKSLHLSYLVFQQNYIKGQIYNKVLMEEMNQHFLECLLKTYTKDSNAMPENLMARIFKMIEVEVEQFNLNWYENNLDSLMSQEFKQVLTEQLLKEWHGSSLNPFIKEQLDQEKNKINGAEALLSHFRDKKLPEKIQIEIQKAIIREIGLDWQSDVITNYSALGSAYLAQRHDAKIQDDYHIITPIIQLWQNRQTSADLSKELEPYILKIIGQMQKSLESVLTQQFSELAVQIFLNSLQAGNYEEEVVSSMMLFSNDIAKELLLHNFSSENSEITKSKQFLIKKVMSALHQSWLRGELSIKESEFIKTNVFASFDELADQIYQSIWSNKKPLQDEVRTLKETVAEQSKLIKELVEMVGQLRLSPQGAAPDKEVNKAISFFGK